MSERYPDWKVELFRNRNVGQCTCSNDHIPGVTREKFSPWCSIHGDPDVATKPLDKRPQTVVKSGTQTNHRKEQ